MVTVSQVTNASNIELICLTYEIFLERVQNAIDNKENFKYHTEQARKALYVLVNGLNLQDTVAGDIFQILVYVQQCLLKYDTLQDAYTLGSELKAIFDELASREPVKQVAMKNTSMWDDRNIKHRR